MLLQSFDNVLPGPASFYENVLRTPQHTIVRAGLVHSNRMLISRRRFSAAALGGLVGSLPRRLNALAARPKLFVFVIAEQFRPVYLDRVSSQLGDGGFRRLRKSGAYYPNCRLTGSSFTASGIATLVTSAYPEMHGVVADRWFDRKTNALVKGRAE